MSEEIRRALTFGEGPLLRQGLFLGPFVVSVLLVSLGDLGALGPSYAVGLVVVVVASAVAVLLHRRPDPRLLWLVPVLDLAVESTTEEGTDFEVRLPRRRKASGRPEATGPIPSVL